MAKTTNRTCQGFELYDRYVINLIDRSKAILLYYYLLLWELFSYSVVLCGIVPEPTARSLYITRQHYRKTVLEGEDNNMFST